MDRTFVRLLALWHRPNFCMPLGLTRILSRPRVRGHSQPLTGMSQFSLATVRGWVD